MGTINSAVILSGLLLYIGNALKSVPKFIGGLIKTRLGVSIQCNSDINKLYFHKIDKLLISFNKKCIMNHSKMDSVWNNELEKYEQILSVGFGNYCFMHNHNIFIVSKTKLIKNDMSKSNMVQELAIDIIGFTNKQMKDIIEKQFITEEDNTIEIDYTSSGYHPKIQVPKRSFDSIILKEKDLLINHIYSWKNDKQFYIDHGLTYKTGILLYGPSGTGKSSIAKCIASELNMNIMIVNLAVPSQTLSSHLNEIKGGCVILIEDIDCIMNIDRDNENNNDVDAVKREKLQILLNFLDGIKSPNNVIFVATTNHIEDLDEALIRAGRFDLQIHVDYFDRTEAEEMCNNFGMELNELMNTNKISFPIKPSLLQNEIILYKNNNKRDD